MDWHEYYIGICKEVAKKSKDPSTQVGAVIVGPDHEIRSTGWNGFPRGVLDHSDRYLNRELKYQMVAHSEMNAIFNAARVGTPLNGCTLYVYPLPVCNNCAIGIIQVGIKEVVMVNSKFIKMPIWEEKFKLSMTMFEEAGVDYRFINVPE